jgi:glycosyltransferase involved in cell wall biosynthesis
MNVSIIIPVYKRTNWIQNCLNMIQAQRYGDSYEIIIVDDGSPNGHAFEKIIVNARRRQSSSCIHYIRKDHVGPAAARNYGVRFSKGDILCFLDDDSMPVQNWLEEITQPFGIGGAVAIVSGKTLSFDRREGLPLLLEKTVYPRKSMASCNIAYNRKVFESLGGFDELFTEASWEDNDLCLRARWRGYRHLHNEAAIVYHSHEKTLDEYKKKCLLNGRGAAIFSRKYITRKPFWALATPLFMSRRILYAILPSVWMKRTNSPAYLKYLWSRYSIRGFISTMKERSQAEN